ncbi:hypothetical protein V5O48_017493 [Marasmius crinis-equi]|uniref:Uncharacterized protein n=1 Tax=Marasmius crinis-equi TaxID=585013 RepID=A0ABR3ENU0_9AGAR
MLNDFRGHECGWACMFRELDPPLTVSVEDNDDVMAEVYLGEMYVELNIDQKQSTFLHVLADLRKSPNTQRLQDLQEEHQLTSGSDVSEHLCNATCKIRAEDAVAARQVPLIPTRIPGSSSEQRRHNRAAAREQAEMEDENNLQWWEENWPSVPSAGLWKEILGESLDSTTSEALRRSPCSFCNRNDLVTNIKRRRTSELNITLLEKTTERLQQLKQQPLIQSHWLIEGDYNVCPVCWQAVKAKKFV